MSLLALLPLVTPASSAAAPSTMNTSGNSQENAAHPSSSPRLIATMPNASMYACVWT
jgi:hypothetical protein